ncbi:hypothetical protein DYB32_009327 [Aphanomyces invadans]|uniref:Transposase Tc1-like domain-containing protein n=1 Tax=Aphanomyces invadans TaxID=157072 RepID=A0A3R6WFI4_9STRA|nr:hypothetical protein DYB32_009327 [Aphanomyces invadans]
MRQDSPACLERYTPKGKIPNGVAVEIGQMFDVTPTTVRRIWRRGAVNLTGQKTICLGVHQRKKGNCGRKRLHDDLPQRIQTIPQSRRYCFRTIAHLLKIPTSTLHCYFKRGVITKYSTVLKSALTDSNKVCRLKCVIKHVQDVDGTKFFDPMLDTVHVDEMVLHDAIAEEGLWCPG